MWLMRKAWLPKMATSLRVVAGTAQSALRQRARASYCSMRLSAGPNWAELARREQLCQAVRCRAAARAVA
jgi:hypothetical protein